MRNGDEECSRARPRRIVLQRLIVYSIPGGSERAQGGPLALNHMQRNERTFKVTDVHKLEDPERLQWLPPDDAVRLLKLSNGMTLADIGAGTGYFAIPFARAVAPCGQVFAVDPQPEMLAILRDKLREPDKPSNILVIQGTATATQLPSVCCEVVFLANVWHELDDHRAALREAARVVTPGRTNRYSGLAERHARAPGSAHPTPGRYGSRHFNSAG